MKDNLKKINNAGDVRLEVEEKAIIKKSVVDYIDAHLIPSPYAKYFGFLGVMKRHAVPVLAVIVVIFGIGAGALAQNALPGDILYPVKLNVNEKLETFLATTPQAVAQVGMEQAVRRLTEAEALLNKGELTASTTAEINNHFNRDVSLINKQISELESRGATTSAIEIKDKFQNQVDKHSRIYFRISGQEDNNKQMSAGRPGNAENRAEKADKNKKSTENTMTATSTQSTSTRITLPVIKPDDSLNLLDTQQTATTTPKYRIQSGQNDDNGGFGGRFDD